MKGFWLTLATLTERVDEEAGVFNTFYYKLLYKIPGSWHTSKRPVR